LSDAAKFSTRILTDESDMRALLPDWQTLWDRCPRATAFQRPEWLLSWIEIFQPTQPRLIEVRLQQQLVGLFPLLIYSRGTERVLGFMGGGVSDYLDALIAPEHEREVLALLWTIVRQEITDWDTLHLTEVPPTSVLLPAHPTAPFAILPHDVCPILDLPARVEDLRTVVPFRKTANLRNARNRMAQAGAVRLEIASTHTIGPLLDTLFEMHTFRWEKAGQPGVLADGTVREFHHRLALPLVKQGVLRLYALYLAGHTIAILYTLFEKSTVLLYLHAFDPAHAYFSPGTYIFGAVIEDAIRAGKRQVNFLRGTESYKYSWGARDTRAFAIQASRAELPARFDEMAA
jgi:CelD/BcsL family acetyltransferase involved in cellulose biosynthesis